MKWLKKVFRYIFYSFFGSIAVIFIALFATYFYHAVTINKYISNLEQSVKPINSCQSIESNIKDSSPHPKRLNELIDMFESRYSWQLASQVVSSTQIKSSLKRHAVELVYFLEIRRIYSYEKRRQIYLDTVYLGQNKSCWINGFRAASVFYYQKGLKDLSSNQLLFLVMLVRGPSYLNPFRNPERAANRMVSMLDTFCTKKNLNDISCAFEGIESLNLVVRD